MGVFQNVVSVFGKKSRTLGAPEAGVARGKQVGHLGVWVLWDAAASPIEVFRVVVTPTSADSWVTPVAPFTYTLAPAIGFAFAQSVEMPCEMKEFLAGAHRAQSGSVSFDFYLTNEKTLTVKIDLEKVFGCYRGKGDVAPSEALWTPGYLSKDAPEVASLKRAELRGFSEAAKKRLEEKCLREEEEARKREEEKKKAEEAAKVAAAKAAADAAAKSAAKSGAPAPAAARPTDRNAPTIQGGKVGIFYGSSTGNTSEVARMLKEELGEVVAHLKNVTEINPIDLTVPEVLIVGVPTWNIGEMQEDWAAILPEVEKLAFSGKKIAVFGLGDYRGYPDTYVDAMQELFEKFKGASLHGLWPTEGYEFNRSKAIKDGKFIGLVIDVENQDQFTEKRVKDWAQQLKSEMSL